MYYKGICQNKGKEIQKQDALCYTMQHCGIQITNITDITKEFAEMLVDWYFSSNWIEVQEDEE